MKKTTPAIIATFITTTILGASMLMIGIDATRASTSVAASTTISNTTVQTQQNTPGIQPVSMQLTTTQSSFRAATLRTGGS